MVVVNPEKLVALQRNPEGIRNICILAHVDHGKTSLTDALIATNGIISPKLAGKIRYLDSRPDEQTRGITMESSAISLYFAMLRRSAPDATPEQKEYLINLIDSPGHIDFSSEVSTASRLCDGAVVLVDAVEGVCSQTVTVLRQTWVEHMKPLLVINKMDRLITELKMTPAEAYTHLSKLLEQVNAVLGSFFQGERMEEDLNWRERVEERVAAAKEQERTGKDANGKNGTSVDTDSMSASADFEERDDEDIYFAPEKNNVIFSSAIDGWAFTVRQFASLYEKKLGIKRTAMEKVLWGDFYLDPKTKKVLSQKHLKGRNLKPMFVQLVLEQIWAVYSATTGGDTGKGDPALVEKITKGLNLTLPAHVLRSRDPRAILTTLFAAWLPISTALLVSCIESLPSPPVAQESRLPALIENSPGSSHVDPNIREAMIKSKSSEKDPVVAYVSKMVSIPESELPENKRRGGIGGALSPEEAREMGIRKRAEISRAQAIERGEVVDPVNELTSALGGASLGKSEAEEKPPSREHLIGFARIYSGTLSVGDSVYVLPPKFSPANPHNSPEPKKVTITALYLLMGRGLEPLTSVPAGVVFGIGGLEGHILKSGTLCSQLEGSVNLAGVNMGTQPIVRVALEPAWPGDLDKMIAGLKLLVQSDPCAEYEQFASGEHVLLTAGELHLERCLTDLKERFANCEIEVGEPIVPYRETIVRAEEMKPPANKELGRGTVIAVTPSKQVSVRLRVIPLPIEVTNFLIKNSAAVQKSYSRRQAEEKSKQGTGTVEDSDSEDVDADAALDTARALSPPEFKKQLQELFVKAGQQDIWANAVDRISAFGPRRVGPNILVDNTKDNICGRFLGEIAPEERQVGSTLTARDFADKIRYAFQLSTARGPLCNEPVQGLAVFLEEFTVTPSTEDHSSVNDKLGRITGEVLKTIRGAIKDGFLDWSPRLLLAMYSCEIQASTDVLGRVYDVLTRRRGRILSEALNEGTPFYTIVSLLPVAESFGFSDEIRKRTSGAASPQLIFQGYEILDEDPFWVPFTEDDLEDLGELADKENVAKRYMDKVRSRKGLVVQGRKVVKDAEKQKTLKR